MESQRRWRGVESLKGCLAPTERSDVSFTLPLREPLHSTELQGDGVCRRGRAA